MPNEMSVDNLGGADDASPADGQEVDSQDDGLSLEEWAERGDSQASKPRGEQGRFRKLSDSEREASEVLRQTVKGLERPKVIGEPSKRARMPQEAREEGQEGEGSGEGQEEAPEGSGERTPQKARIVINGKTEEVDLNDPRVAKLNAVQAMRAAQETFREAANIRKEAMALRAQIEAAKGQISQNPMALFEALGIDRDSVLQFAQRQVYDKVSETIDPNTGQPYTPEQQRILQLQNELKRREQLEQQAKQQQEFQEQEQLREVMRQDIDRKFTQALEATGLPATPYTMMRLADLMSHMGPDADPQMLAPIVLEDITKEAVDTIGSFPMELVVKLLPKKFFDQLRKYDNEQVAKARQPFNTNPRTLPGNRGFKTNHQIKDPTNPREAEDWLEKWANS